MDRKLTAFLLKYSAMNILITAGGTSEPIDSVRCITNGATGRLGSLTADCFAASRKTVCIFYLCGKGACRPETPLAQITEIAGAAELEKAARDILAHNRVDAIIHSMAVSDYRTCAVSTAGLLAADLAAALEENAKNPKDLKLRLESRLQNPPAINRETKISSAEKKLILFLEPVPKIISLFSALAPEAILVGFKMLSQVSKDELIDAAYSLLLQNRCAFVLANDKTQINAQSHIGYLVDQNKNARRFESKREIAEGITESVLAAFAKRNAIK
ncbi:MAG: phosphopantothenoylcysteine synthase [Spirochaetaceae bacterium]|jgi:phosphopantothenate-cysteine ligase|nr:phosphopantothenoylcysteine synthase [Spirochaetaceae bacterium]